MSTGRDQGDRRRDRAQQSQPVRHRRYALLFKPGTYGTAAAPLNFQVGYYTEVAGLGSSPSDVTVNGTIDVYNQCFGPGDCTALVNFWRSLSNLTIQVAGKGRLPVRRVLGDLAGGADAARPRQRANAR